LDGFQQILFYFFPVAPRVYGIYVKSFLSVSEYRLYLRAVCHRRQ